jgi:hypothetical protein
LEKKTKNPDKWFTELEHIRVLLFEDHGFNVTEERMIQHIVNNLKPKPYETTVYILKRDLQYNNANLILRGLKMQSGKFMDNSTKLKPQKQH